MDRIHSILREFWGYNDFRPLQQDIIQSVLDGHDTLGLMPTGGGKSITFQVPALAKKGICIVVTPLIALMKDQVENLKDKGIIAEAIYSGLSKDDINRILDNCVLGDYKFLYVSPERIGTDTFIKKFKLMNVSMIAVDESHCISQWGYDFRPAYMQIADLRLYHPNVPILALTATATPEVVQDIQDKLAFRTGCKVFKKSFQRDNLAYVVKYTDDKLGMMLKILDAVPGTSVVYVRNRAKTKEISEFLKQSGISADFYHAGISNNLKDIRQNAWKNDLCRVIVATNAFGMGIDKPNVRTVIHLDLPDSLEAYFQEAGRAGRDGEKAYAVLIYSDADGKKLKKRVSDTFPSKELCAQVYNALFNYFQIAENEGAGSTYAFSISLFCKYFHFSITQAEGALALIQQAGYIELHEETENRSKVIFSVTRDELYTINTNHTEDNVMSSLMRTYTGLFCDYAYIDEELVAEKTGISRQLVYETLVELRQKGIINYIPYKKEPCITVLRARVDLKYFSIPKHVYEVRKEQFQKRIDSVLYYATNKTFCRSSVLLKYFGEISANDCQKCDNCINKKKQLSTSASISDIQKTIIDRLKERNGQLNAQELLFELASEDQTALRQAIKWMFDNGIIAINKTGKIEVKNYHV